AAPKPAPSPEAPEPAPPPVKDAFDLVDVTAQVGLRFTHKKGIYPAALANIGPWLASIGAASAVTDFDGDGRMDLYFTSTATGSLNSLYRNNGDGTFSDVAAKAGLADVNTPQGSLRPLFFDFDLDGDPDLVLTTQYCTRVFRNKGDGTFEETTAAAGIAHCGLAYASNALDLDGDGDLDLVIGDYFPQVDLQVPSRFDFMQNSLTTADNGGEVLLYENDGTGRFKPFKDNLGVKTDGWAQAVGVWDVDGDGRSDLYLAVDYNNDHLYLNKGGPRLVDASSRLENKYSRNGMNSEFADLEGDGRPSVYVTHIYEPPYKLGGNTLWTFDKGLGPARERAKDLGVAACGWAWGAKFADFDSDGFQDLVVTNGYISQNPDKNYWYRMSVLAAASRAVMADARNWPPIEDYSMSGFQRKCVYRNVAGHFELVTHETGMKEDVGDGRGLAVVDPFDEGSPSLLATYIGGPARLWRAVPKAGNAWVGFKLLGKRPRDAWGAAVTVTGGGRVQRREVEPGNSFMSQSDPRLLFGLGPGGKAEDVTVRWPSGKVQKLGPLAAGRYHTLQEP
ncbi:CRTAC1 family protein, partial [bacterium]